MNTIKFLLVEAPELGQPESVTRLWKNAFHLKGIEYYDTRRWSELTQLPANALEEYATVVLGSLPNLSANDVDQIKRYLDGGGHVVASGPVGEENGPSPEFCKLAGINEPRSNATAPIVPLLDTLITPFQRGDALLFLQDNGPVPEVEPESAQVRAGSLSWNPQYQKYVNCDFHTIFSNQYGKGGITYVSVALGDENRIPPQRAGEYIPGGNAPGSHNIGHPYYSSLHAATLSFMTALIDDAGTGYAATGHWPNGWRIAINLTGDVHELDQYINFQSGAARRVADFLESENLDGLYTYSVTGQALDEEPELYRELERRGYEVVPHSTYEAKWMNELSEEESIAEIEKCFDAFKRHLGPESLLGWRSHGWSGNDSIEKLLDSRGVTWLSNLILHRYGEFGPRDRYIADGNGVAFLCLPEKTGHNSMIRLPNTYFSPDWVRSLIMGNHYGIAKGPELDEVLYDFLKQRFFRDWRFEALHMVDWHPWEEFVDEPIFDRSVRDLVSLFKTTPNVGIINPTELTKWWNYRENIQINELKAEGQLTEIKARVPPNPTDTNPTIRISQVGWRINGVTINDEIEWCFYGTSWVALPRDLAGEVKILVRKGRPSTLPTIIDTSAVVYVAEKRDGGIIIELEEKRRKIGILTLFVPRTVEGELDGIKLEEPLMGHVAIPLPKGTHRLVLKPLMRTTVLQEKDD